LKQVVGKVVDHMTQGNCNPTNSVTSGDDHSTLVHNTGVGHIYRLS